MRTFRKSALVLGLSLAALGAGAVLAQPPGGGGGAPATPPAQVSQLVAMPTYVTIPLKVTVNGPAKDVWAKIGKFCDIGAWLQTGPCTQVPGPGGPDSVGSVRSVAGEVMVGKTDLSYTYTQTVAQASGQGRRPYNLYHGTVEAVAISPTTTELRYTLFYDNSMLADDAARQTDITNKTNQFQTALNNMKIIAEGGTLPPRAAGGGRGGGGGGGGRGGGAGGPPGGGGGGGRGPAG